MAKSRNKPSKKDKVKKPKKGSKKLPAGPNDPNYVKTTPPTKRKGFVTG